MRAVAFAIALAALAAPAPSLAAECYGDDAVREVSAMRGPISANAEELVHMAISEGVSRDDMYMLTRQMLLIERIHRRLLERDGCEPAAEAIGRDFAIMKRVFIAYAEGDAELEIEPLKAEQSQALLGELLRQVAALETTLGSLGVTMH